MAVQLKKMSNDQSSLKNSIERQRELYNQRKDQIWEAGPLLKSVDLAMKNKEPLVLGLRRKVEGKGRESTPA